VLAQAGDNEEESETGTTSGAEETQTEEGSEEGGREAESGAGEEATTETGPPWTYQMARIALVLLALLGLAVGLLYWRLIVSRQRGAA
jgi:cobalamin biosynthesis Mg chelatase CobN